MYLEWDLNPQHSDFKSDASTVGLPRPVFILYLEVRRIELLSYVCKTYILTIELYPQNSLIILKDEKYHICY